VELGLPELAYHQAETLTSLESDNGLAWGVVAYVEARRGQMPEAISAIVLAGQFAPDNAFVQRTAGELTAWYDLKGDKSTLTDSTKEGIAKVRAVLSKRTAFTDAYSTASKAYQSQATATTPPAQSSVSPTTAPAQPQGYDQQGYDQSQGYYAGPADGYAGPAYDYAAALPYPDYPYPYYYGLGWSPWWWPVGFFGGFDFFPFDHHDHDDFHHGHFHDHDGHFHGGHNDNFFHATHNGGKFFGGPSHPNFAARTSDPAHFHGAPAPGVRNSSPTTTRALNTAPRMTTPGTTMMNRGATVNRSFAPVTRTWNNTPMSSTRTWNNNPAPGNRGWNNPAFSSRAWSAPQGNWAPRTFSSPAFAAPRGGGFASSGGFHGGGFQGGGGFHGGGGMGGGHGGGGGGHR